jgi:C1A family cysteine protease
MAYRVARFGWTPDRPDHRDLAFEAPAIGLVDLPPVVDLRPGCPPVYDQGDEGSCVGQATAGAFAFEALKQGQPPVTPSRQWIYYQARVLEHTVHEDAGCMIRDGMKVLARLGVPPESSWPYTPETFALRPSHAVYAEALTHQVLRYLRVRHARALQACLAAGYPVVAGFTCYESLEHDGVTRTGDVPMPALSESVIGGHAVLLVGYDRSVGRWRFRNSWGAEWGAAGYGTLPFAYLPLMADFWSIRLIEG